MTPCAYFNGRFVSETDACIHLDDGGWLHGAGLFETMRAENGCVFRYGSHLQRIQRSASELLSPIEPSLLPNPEDAVALLNRNELSSARVRLTVSAGRMRYAADDTPSPTVCLTAVALQPYADRYYDEGVQAAICDFRLSPSDPTAGHKTTAYLPRLLALRHAQRVGCFEALWFTTSNHLAEGSISNLFMLRDGVLKTPPLETPVLPGIARGVVCEMAESLGVAVHQVPLTIDDLLDAQEAFLTNAVMQVMPLVRIEKRDIGEGRVGKLTRQLQKDYSSRVRKECQPL